MSIIAWNRYPLVSQNTQAKSWLLLQTKLASNTIDAYDCTPRLTKEELLALNVLFALRKSKNTYTPPSIKKALNRLMKPVSDVLDFAEARDQDRRGLNRLLLCIMHRRQSPYWAWSQDEWLEIFCPTIEAFRQHHTTDYSYRYYLIVFSRQQK
jgi:hypothetical protein